MTNLKRYRRNIFFLICLISLSALLFGCNNQKQHNKFGFISKNDIISFREYNLKAEAKEIKSKSDRDKIIDLINSVHIIKSGVEPVDGMGFGIIITYSNGEKFTANFGGTSIFYSTDNTKIWCRVDKNIYDDLGKYYDIN